MQVIVITGSTRGIGRGLAEQLLLRGAAVVLSGRDPAAVATASAALASNSAAERVMGKACDVRDPVQVQALWDAALARFGRVDCWVNNAGCGTLPRRLTDLPASDAERVVGTNQIGTLVCCHVAIAGMEAQGCFCFCLDIVIIR